MCLTCFTVRRRKSFLFSFSRNCVDGQIGIAFLTKKKLFDFHLSLFVFAILFVLFFFETCGGDIFFGFYVFIIFYMHFTFTWNSITFMFMSSMFDDVFFGCVQMIAVLSVLAAPQPKMPEVQMRHCNLLDGKRSGMKKRKRKGAGVE